MNTLMRMVGALAVLTALVAPSVNAADAGSSGARYKVVFQVSDNDPAKWGLALNNIRNIQQDLGRDNVRNRTRRLWTGPEYAQARVAGGRAHRRGAREPAPELSLARTP